MPASPLEIRTILDDVVHQFADPLAFVRELVQNSIDAGTGEIEIDINLEGDSDREMAVITVRDWGEGMNREIIDGRLLRLFSSGKDEDLTKIGRFGIGFVSVFAIEPDAVVVDTGREGQYWRIFFDEEREYELYALDAPIEGTRVRIYKSMADEDFQELKQDLRQVLVQWCKYAEIPVRLDGDDIRQRFEVPSRLSTTYREEGTRVVIGFCGLAGSGSGYYNRGLTLKEDVQSPWPWVNFKIDSRYLEHTLTRDQVLEDRHFSKAMALLEELAENVLPEQLMDGLEELAASPNPGEEYQTYCQYLAHYLRCGQSFRRAWRGREIFAGPGEESASLRDINKANRRGELRMTRLDDRFAQVFDGEDNQLLTGGPGLQMLLEQLFEDDIGFVEDEHLVLEALRRGAKRQTGSLQQALEALLQDEERGVDEVLVVAARALPTDLRGDGAVVVPTSKGIVAPSTWQRPIYGDCADYLCAGHTLVVNAGADEVDYYVGLANREPEWAAVALLESLFFIGDDALWGRAVEHRSGTAEERL